MAYVFDPINNTLIDDEDKSLGNKLALNDEEFQKLLDIPGVFRASQAPQPPVRPDVQEIEMLNRFMRDNPRDQKAKGGRLKAAVPLLAPALLPYAAAFLGTAATGLGLQRQIQNYFENNPDAIDKFKDYVSRSIGYTGEGQVFGPDDKDRKEAEPIILSTPAETKGIKDYRESFGDDELAESLLKTKPEIFPADPEKLPTTSGETKPIDLGPSFFEKRNIKEDKYSPKKYQEKALEDLNPETVTDIDKIVDDYRKLKTRPAGPVTYVEKSGRVRTRDMPASTQPRFKEEDKLELLNLVINAYEKRENKKPSATELKRFIPFFTAESIAKKYNIKLGKRIAAYDRKDPGFITAQKENKQLKANENNTITSYEEEFFFPKTITLENGAVVDGKKFFIDNLTKKTELGPGRKETLATTLKDKDLAKLYNTNIFKIERASKAIRNDPNFKADYPEPRPVDYGDKIARERIKKAREYLKPNELTNVKLQEKHIKNVNDLFKDGTLVVTDFPNLVESINTTIDKKTGIIDRSIKKTDEEMIERSKENSGLFDVSHTISKTEVEKGAQNIEFLRNRNFSDYKFNQGFLKSAEAYVKNEMDDPEYDLRLDELDNYLKEIGQRVKIGNKFFGLDEAMIDSETGEFLGFNRQLEYYGLPKMENGVPLKKIKKASGGGVEISPLPRANFGNGGAAGADDNFLKELEFYFTNDDAELPKMQTYKETMNPVEVLNDIIDPRNYPYYADVLARSGVRIAEFAGRILPATGKLVSDLTQKPAFKITSSGENSYVQDYTDILPSNIKGTGIFSEFLENITPTTLEKKVGLDKLIKAEEQKQIERGSTVGPKVFADTIGLGTEVGAPIFPGLKLLNSFAKARNLPNDKVTQKILEKEVDKVLSEKGMTRREFLQATGAGATIVMAKMLGLTDVAPKATKVARAVPVMDNTVQGMPAWFKDAVYAIQNKGILKSRGDIKGIEPDFFEITLDTKLGKRKVLMSKNDTSGEITLDWTTDYYDMDIPVTITYRPGQSGKQNFLSDPEIPQSVEKYDVEVEAPEFEYKTVDTDSMGPEDTSFDSAVNLDIKEEADAVVEALEELGLGLTKKQKKDAADNFRYYNEVQLDEGSGPDTMNPIDENDAFPFLDEVERNK